MKIVISVEKANAESLVDPRFGRCPYFAVVSDDHVMFVENAAESSGHGAGIQAAQAVVELGATDIISGHVGPKAWQVLHAAGIHVYQAEGIALADAVAKLRTAELPLLQGATGPGHSGKE